MTSNLNKKPLKNIQVKCMTCQHGGAGPNPPYVCDKCGGTMIPVFRVNNGKAK